MDALVGFFVGALCGVLPLLFGLFTKHKVLAIVSIVVTAISGILFGMLAKSPFTAIGIAIIFVVLLFAKNKNKNTNHEEDHEEYLKDE